MSTTGPLNPDQLTRGKTLNEFCVGPRLYENSKVRSATRMIFSSSILQLNALAMWTPKTTFNEELVLSRLIAFAFSHGLGQ
jgi:hypothetical protein